MSSLGTLSPAPSAPDPITFGVHLEKAVPRYGCYPTVASFHDGIGRAERDAWLRALPAGGDVEVTVHVPFCEQICWYCLCRTQTLRAPAVIEGYLDALVSEIAAVGAGLPKGLAVGRMVWRGGSPAVLQPAGIARLRAALEAHLPLAPRLEFGVEIDPATAPVGTVDALGAAGVTEAILSVQDRDQAVQAAIGRVRDMDSLREGVKALRQRGIPRLVVDHLYGLPYQTEATVAESARAILELGPDQVTLTGYAHVPAIAKRQRMIREDALPDVRGRLAQFEVAAACYAASGYRAVGIDHFVRPGDRLGAAAETGRLRRGPDGYSGDAPAARIGFGAGGLSSFAQGYVQNVGGTRAYCDAVARHGNAASRGVALTLDDRVRARAIDMLLCGFRIDLAAIREEFGDFAALVERDCLRAVETYRDHVARAGDVLAIVADRPVMARLVARLFDTRTPACGAFALAV